MPLVHPTTVGSNANVLACTSMFCDFQRQLSTSGDLSMAGVVQVETLGTSRVQSPLDVFAGLLQKRSAFSHTVMPDQLLSKVLPVMSILVVRAGMRGSPPDSLRYTEASGKSSPRSANSLPETNAFLRRTLSRRMRL